MHRLDVRIYNLFTCNYIILLILRMKEDYYIKKRYFVSIAAVLTITKIVLISIIRTIKHFPQTITKAYSVF